MFHVIKVTKFLLIAYQLQIFPYFLQKVYRQKCQVMFNDHVRDHHKFFLYFKRLQYLILTLNLKEI